MNIASAIQFGLAALNLGLMIQSIMEGSWAWCISLGAFVFCFYMGIASLD